MRDRNPGRRPLSARSFARFAIILALAIAALDLVGWVLSVPLLKSISSGWIPMKPITAVCFILAASAVALIQRADPGENGSEVTGKAGLLTVARFLAWAIILVGLLTATDYMLRVATGQPDPAQGIPLLDWFLSPAAGMALLTAALFVLLGSALLLLTERSLRAANAAHAIAVPAVLASYLVPLSYVLGVQSLHNWLGTPVALNTGIAFCAIWIAIFCVRPGTWFMRVFTGEHAGGVMSRRLLPWLLALPLVIGWLRLHGERVGFYESDVGVALVAIAYTICFVWLVWLSARSVNRTDDQRRAAERAVRESEQKLRRFNAELEQRVAAKTAELREVNATLEQRVAERTAELTAANELLSASRLAALNITEDALASRNEAELARAELARSNESLAASRRAALNITEDAVEARKRAEHARVEQARITRLFNVLSQVNEMIVRTRERDVLLQQACGIIAETGDFPLVWVGMAAQRGSPKSQGPNPNESPTPNPQSPTPDPGTLEIVPVAAAGEAVDYLKEIKVTLDGVLGQGPTGTSVRESRPVVNQDFDVDAQTKPWRAPARKYGFRSSASFPLFLQDRAVGALTLYAAEPGAFDPDQVRLLTALAADLSFALQALRDDESRRQAEAQLLEAKEELEVSAEELRLQNDELESAQGALKHNQARHELLARVAGDLLASTDPQQVVNDLCRRVMEFLDCAIFVNFIVDEPSHRLRLNACAGIPPKKAKLIEWLDFGAAVCGAVAQSGERITAVHIQTRPDPRTALVRSMGVDAYCCHPLKAHDRVLGTLSFGAANRPDFRPEEIDLMREVADQVSTALERVRVLQEVRLTRDYLENLISHANAPIIVWDPQFRITQFNRAFERLTGRAAQEVMGKELDILFPPERRQESLDLIRRTATGERWEAVEIAIQHRDRSVRMVLWNSATLYTADGRTPIATIAQGHDITDRKLAEQALARNEAEYREFTQLLAHSIKSPLSTVRLTAQQMNQDHIHPSREVILEQVERLNRIALGLMYLSEPKLHRRDHVNLNEVVNSTLIEHTGRIEPDLVIDANLASDLPGIRANEQQLIRVLGNLVDNGVSAMDGKGRLTVTTQLADSGREVMVEVSDTGPGIPDAYRAKLFQPFFSRKPGGTGLGLSIAKRVIEDHGGRIELAESDGKGACFRIYLPVEDD